MSARSFPGVTRVSTTHIHARSLDYGKTAKIVVPVIALCILLVVLLVVRFIRSRRREPEETGYWSCRGKLEDLERAQSQSHKDPAMEVLEMCPVNGQSQTPIQRSVTGSIRTEKTPSPRSDSGYGPSPVSTIKSSHATTRSLLLARPALVNLSLKRSISRMSRIVSGETLESHAEGESSSSASGQAAGITSPSQSSPQNSSLPAPIRVFTPPHGLVFLPVSAASPDGS